MKRKERMKEFLEGVYAVSLKDPDDEGSFSMSGCDACNNALGNSVYECVGLNEKTNEEVDEIYLCGKCLSYIYNGDGGEEDIEE